MKEYKCVFKTEIWIDIEADSEEEAEYKMNKYVEREFAYLEGVVEIYENNN